MRPLDRAPFGRSSFGLVRLVLVALGLMGLLRRRAVVLGLFCVLLVGHAVQGYVPSSLDRFASHVQLATFFMAGAVTYLYRDRIRRSYDCLQAAVLVTAATAIVEVGFLELLPITGTYLLHHLAYEPRLLRLRVGRRTDLSYGNYLYAWPVQQLIVQSLGPALSPYSLSLSALAVSAGLAWLSWRFVERPFLALKRQGARAPGPVQPAMDPLESA